MITVLYRISSGEVVKISQKGQSFDDRNQTFWGVLTDPSFSDGTDVRPVDANLTYGELRQLGYAKIVDGSVVRNATQAEIDTFAGAEADDEAQQDAEQAKAMIENHPQFRKFAMVMFKAMNQIRQDAGLTPWTKQQIITFVRNNISKND